MTTKQKSKRWPLPKRFSISTTDAAYAQLRELSAETGLGNNYLITILLENLDRYADREKLSMVFEDIFSEYGRPEIAAASKQ
ncbi:MAG: hypothetical protein AAGA88_06210 [Pseudomonadota bacterium]